MTGAGPGALVYSVTATGSVTVPHHGGHTVTLRTSGLILQGKPTFPTSMEVRRGTSKHDIGGAEILLCVRVANLYMRRNA